MPPAPRPECDAVVVVPIRSFAAAKGRLATVLDDAARAALARHMAARVVAAAAPRPVVVVSSAPEVRHWAGELGLAVIADPGSLDAAAAAGREWARLRHATRVVVAHADLPFAEHLDRVTGVADDVVAIVPCHRGDGTPVLSLPAAAPFRFSYGPGSFARHRAEAERLGLPVEVVLDHALGFDVDVPADLDAVSGWLAPGRP